MPRSWMATLSTLASIGAALLAWQHARPRVKVSLYTLKRRRVPQVSFSDARSLASLASPTILKDSPIENWPALRWSIGSLLTRSRNPKLFWASKSSTFKYKDESQALTDAMLKNGLWKPTFSDVNMTLAEFIALNEKRLPGDVHYYYTGEAQDEDGRVLADVKPVEALLPREPGAEDGFRVNTWVAWAGTAMHAHYDLAHNIFVHIIGRKVFYLLPPSAAAALYVAPRHHPQFRSSLIDDLSAVDLHNHPLFAAVDEVWHVELSPGDVLYIPPGCARAFLHTREPVHLRTREPCSGWIAFRH